MIIKQLLDEDFVNYKVASMFIGFPTCTFKCEKECGIHCCQNSELALAKSVEISVNKIIERYINNSITSAIVCGGLEPFDSWNDLYELVKELREKTNDMIVIYTGYYKSEIIEHINLLKKYMNITIKFGRYTPNQQPHLDLILGVSLASDNQYAEQIS